MGPVPPLARSTCFRYIPYRNILSTSSSSGAPTVIGTKGYQSGLPAGRATWDWIDIVRRGGTSDISLRTRGRLASLGARSEYAHRVSVQDEDSIDLRRVVEGRAQMSTNRGRGQTQTTASNRCLIPMEKITSPTMGEVDLFDAGDIAATRNRLSLCDCPAALRAASARWSARICRSRRAR